MAIPSIFYLTSTQLQGQELPGLPSASAQVPTPCPNISTDTVLTYSCVVDSHYSGIIINPGVTLTINPGVTITSYNDITANGNIVNYGTINFQASHNLYVYSTLTNHNNIMINNYAQLVNYGTVLNYGGTITNSYSGIINGGLLNNNGTVDNIFATFQNNQEGVVNNRLHGTFINSLGNLFNYGTINNNCGAIFTNTGSIMSNPITFATCFATSAAITPSTSSASTGSSLVFNATISDTSSTPTTPTGTISWSDGSAGGKFANSATCTLSGSGSTSSCTISYTAPLSAKSVVITGQYAGDLTHSSSSATSHLTVIAPDTVAPTTTVTLAGTAGTNGWYTSQVTATLAAADNPGGSGVKSTSYSLDGSPQTVYTVPVIVTGDANHTLSFNSTDKAGNAELPHTMYIPIDTAPPVITVPSDVTKEATNRLTRAVLGTSTAVDAVDGPVTVTSNATARYPVGTTVIQYSATDLAGNTATAYQKVTITDTTPPLLQLPAQITAQATGPSGATVSYKANATDIVDGPVTPVCSPASGNTFVYGNTTVTCTATDAHGNKATGAFDVNVQNKIPPTISIASPANNAIVNTATVPVSGTASDIVSVSSISWKVDSGDVSTVSGITPGPNVNWSFDASALSTGTHTIQVNATDSAGLVAISSIYITYAAPTVSIPSPSGAGQVTFNTGNGGFTNLDSIQQSSLPTPPPPGNYSLGFFSWDITGFAPATSVTVTVTSPTPLHHQSHYFKLVDGTWVSIPATVSGNKMTFTMADNGPFDGNPTVGIISDPGAVADPTDGRVTGGGNIGKGTNFGFEVTSDIDKNDSIRGTLEYHDKYVKLNLHSNNVSFLSVDSTTSQATIVGTTNYDRHDKHSNEGTSYAFLTTISDPDKTGEHDTFSITVTDSTGNVVYQNSGTVKGHIEIHKFSDHDDRSDSGIQHGNNGNDKEHGNSR
ncbi:MAG TPA: HYR domain-containing protein [Candidatus Nitrosotalea sp.]|nr:HYR domain-containing protein [Candidatus Nitrosotalea sp.]